MFSKAALRFVPRPAGLLAALLCSTLLSDVMPASAAVSGATKTYRITIENLTPNRGNGASQVLSPPLVVIHSREFNLFTVGEPANQSVIDVAEDAITATGIAALSGHAGVSTVSQAGAPFLPGGQIQFEVESGPGERLSLVTMLVNSNDAFTGLDGVNLTGGTKVYLTHAYDAGSEVNDQLRANIPGPCCGDAGRHGTDESGRIAHHPGFVTGVGDLDPAVWGWSAADPVARITIERIRE